MTILAICKSIQTSNKLEFVEWEALTFSAGDHFLDLLNLLRVARVLEGIVGVYASLLQRNRFVILELIDEEIISVTINFLLAVPDRSEILAVEVFVVGVRESLEHVGVLSLPSDFEGLLCLLHSEGRGALELDNSIARLLLHTNEDVPPAELAQLNCLFEEASLPLAEDDAPPDGVVDRFNGL